MSESAPHLFPDPDPTKHKSVLALLRNKLFAGVAVAIPIVVTIWVLNLAYNTIAGVSAPVLRTFGVDFPWVHFLITLLLFLLLGFMATHVIGRRVIEASECLLLRVPIAATIYGGVKQVMDSIKKFGTGANFKRVVYVEYPSAGHRLIGFVSGYHRMPGGEEVASVFLPTAPNPMTGFVIMVSTKDLIESDLSLDEATRLILSGGLLGPEGKASAVPSGGGAVNPLSFPPHTE